MSTTKNKSTAVQVFENEEFANVRVVEKDGEGWLIAADVCRELGVDNVSQALTRLDSDEKDVILNDTLGGKQKMSIINEAGFYHLVLSSRKKDKRVRRFQRWVTHEVLPTIRKHGVYMTTEALEKAILNPDFMLKVVTELKKEKDARIAAEQTIQEMTPHYELGKKVGDTKAAISVKEFSEVLCKNGHKIGQNNLFRWFVDRGYLYKRGRKYLICQDYLDQKLFDVVEQVFNLPGTEVEQVNVKVMITGKGQDYFLNKFEEEKNLASIQGE